MTKSVSEQTCFHCGLPNPSSHYFAAKIENIKRHFCCLGCESVCKVIYDAGLQGFYQRTPDGQLLAPPQALPKDLALYDQDEVQSEFVNSMGENRDIHLLVEGIHCAACVWLIERTLGTEAGIQNISVNLTNKRLHVKWNNSQISLSEIIKRLGEIGYSALPFDPESAEGALKKHNRALLLRMAFAGFTMMNLLWVSIALYSGADKSEFRSMFHWIGFFLATPTLLYSGWPFLKGAWTGLKQLHLTMDLPIAIGASTTYAYSVYIMLTGSTVGEVYFDTVVNFIFIILVGRFLEAKSKRHAISASQRLLDLQPRVAYVVRGGETHIVPVRSIKEGEIVLVKAGDKVPVDGVVIEGSSSVNEAMLSGESAPLRKSVNDQVSSGTINIESALTVKVSCTLRNTALGKIISLVEEAQASKAPIQRIADKIVPWFVAITLLLASLTFILWLDHSIEMALMAATSVLIITCPCALGLATPMSIAVASGLAAKDGMLIKNSAVLESLSSIDHFVFDKTGTLTEGKMQLSKIFTDNIDEDELLKIIASVEQYSEHSIAKAIVQAAKDRAIMPDTGLVKDFTNQPGYGIKALVNQQCIVIGTTNWLEKNNAQLNGVMQASKNNLEQQGISCIHIAINGQQQAMLAIADKLRPGAKKLIDDLRKDGIKLTLLSGDRQAVAESIAAQLGGMNVIAEVLPEQKDKLIEQLQKNGDCVAMVGDGVNDAPALIRADVGIAVGSGTDVSIESADIILMHNELDKVRMVELLARRTLTTIRQNIAISFTYNVIMVPLAMMALITPLVAAISMPISSLAVIANAARIKTLFNKP
jgi:Cu2+-exporting ATPase